MGVDLTGVTPQLFGVGGFFILLIMSLFSLTVVRLFQSRYRSGILYACGGVVSAVVFGFVLNIWF